MTSFDDREKGYENKYAHEEQLNFKTIARRNKLVGLWAAEQMNLPQDQREAYAKDVVMSDMLEAGDADMVSKILADFQKAGVAIGDKRIREEIARQHPIAREQIMKN